MIRLLSCKSMALVRETQSSHKNPYFWPFCFLHTESKADILHNVIIHSLSLALLSYTHTIPMQQFFQELQLFQAGASLFQNPIFHIFKSFSAGKWEFELKLCGCAGLIAWVLASQYQPRSFSRFLGPWAQTFQTTTFGNTWRRDLK